MEKYLCVHGHFYQPPRENSWLEEVEVQDSAHPYHDWNERISVECYAPNSASRILDGKKRILDIVSNYTQISFNFGPTLLSWMERHTPDVYANILEADWVSRRARSGHGNAIAQVYNHIIMPLAVERDKRTQVIWGIRDFEYRFGRKPEGMWIPETAVDLETLKILAEYGIRFTILAPHQAQRVRPLSGGEWIDVSGGKIDPTRAYRCLLASGRSIDLFFYDAPISRAIAFEGILNNGENFVKRVMTGFSPQRDGPQLLHVATDGESYGHHHRFGDMALAYALHKIRSEGPATLTNYGEFLEKVPPLFEVEIIENSSWSCTHGIERWREDCGCRVGGHPGWNQKWRHPLRDSLNWLKERLDEVFEKKTGECLKDPWEGRNQYISLILDRSPENVEKFFSLHQKKDLSNLEKIEVLKLLEMQRHSLLMFTSCGWFFDDISGIETIQVMRYAARALQLTTGSSLLSSDVEEEFLRRLTSARSNIATFTDGASIYRRFVKPSVVDLRRVVVHYGISSLYSEYPEETRVYCYAVQRTDYHRDSFGSNTLAIGRVRITSLITGEREDLTFGVLHFGGNDFHCSVHGQLSLEQYTEIRDDLLQKFSQQSLTEVVRALGNHLEEDSYTLKDLFIEERRRILSLIIEEILGRFEGTYRLLYSENRKLMEYLRDMDFPLPRGFQVAAEYILTRDLEKEMKNLGEGQMPERVFEIMDEAKKWGIHLDPFLVANLFQQALTKKIRVLISGPRSEDLSHVCAFLDTVERIGLSLDLWEAQNSFYTLRSLYAERLKKEADKGDEESRASLELMARLGEKLYFHS